MGKTDEAIRGKQPLDSEQMIALAGMVLEGIPYDLTQGDWQYVMCNKAKMRQGMRKLLFGGNLPEGEELRTWQRAYGKQLENFFLAFPGIAAGNGIPKGFERLVVVRQDMSMAAILQLYVEANIGINFRDISEKDLQTAGNKRYKNLVGRKSYGVWTRESSDPEMGGISAEEIERLEVSFMNLPEFLLMFWKRWVDQGLRPYADVITVLPDTYFAGGTFPYAQWTGSCLEIGRMGKNFRGARSCGIRQVCIAS